MPMNDASESCIDLPGYLVERSWERCAQWGLSSDAGTHQDFLSQRQLKEQQEQNSLLLELAMQEIKPLEKAIAGTGRIVLLAAPDGLVLDARGDSEFLGRARRVSLQPGSSWSELAVGTNAIGTAVMEQRFVRVRGEQHFLRDNRFLLCSAMPIVSPTGDLAGVIDISTDVRHPFVHCEMLVKTAVAHMEHGWTSHTEGHDLLVRFHPHPSWLNSPREGVLAFRDGLMIGATPHALNLLGLTASAICHTRWEDIFQVAPSYGARELRLQMDGGIVFSHVHRSETPSRMQLAADIGSLPARGSGSNASEITLRDGDVWNREMLAMLARATRAVDANIPILLQGETGTGKEVFVHALHRTGSRSSAAIIPVNCAAIPPDLLESELFGYEDGAFTGARRHGSLGLIRQAHGGILFLDEIGDMPLAAQVRLLRVLQDNEVTPLGGGRSVKVDFRLVAATNRDLTAAVRDGSFRSDLYYRLCHMMLTLPPLRERKDLPGIIQAMMIKLGAVPRGIRLSESALNKLIIHTWPGNMRELANVLHVAVSMAEDGSYIEAEDLPLKSMDTSIEDSSNLADLTDTAIQQALMRCRGNVSAAAKALGIHRSTLYRRFSRLPSAP